MSLMSSGHVVGNSSLTGSWKGCPSSDHRHQFLGTSFGLSEGLEDCSVNNVAYFGLIRLSEFSSAAIHFLGVIPRVWRKSSTNALGCR